MTAQESRLDIYFSNMKIMSSLDILNKSNMDTMSRFEYIFLLVQIQINLFGPFIPSMKIISPSGFGYSIIQQRNILSTSIRSLGSLVVLLEASAVKTPLPIILLLVPRHFKEQFISACSHLCFVQNENKFIYYVDIKPLPHKKYTSTRGLASIV